MSGRDRGFNGIEVKPDEIEAGSPSVENAVFVLLGALSTVLVLVHLAGLLP